jgi:hypothetical protein
VPERVYDETIGILQTAVQKAKLGQGDKLQAIRQLSGLARRAEEDFIPSGGVQEWIDKEREDSWKYGGRTVYGREQPPAGRGRSQQLRLF